MAFNSVVQCSWARSWKGCLAALKRYPAGAAAFIKENNLLGAAAVASRRAAELYGMEVLDEDIQAGPTVYSVYRTPHRFLHTRLDSSVSSFTAV